MTWAQGVKDSCSEDFIIFAEKCPYKRVYWRKLCKVSIFLTKHFAQSDFLEIYKISMWLTV